MNETMNSLRSQQRVFLRGGNQICPMRIANHQSNCTKISIGGHIVGEVREGVFIKSVKASLHFLHTPPAIAFDVKSLQDASHHGANSVKVIDTKSGKVFQAAISTIWSKGFQFDRGHGKQIGLLREYWSRGDEPFGEQLKMWG